MINESAQGPRRRRPAARPSLPRTRGILIGRCERAFSPFARPNNEAQHRATAPPAANLLPQSVPFTLRDPFQIDSLSGKESGIKKSGWRGAFILSRERREKKTIIPRWRSDRHFPMKYQQQQQRRAVISRAGHYDDNFIPFIRVNTDSHSARGRRCINTRLHYSKAA